MDTTCANCTVCPAGFEAAEACDPGAPSVIVDNEGMDGVVMAVSCGVCAVLSDGLSALVGMHVGRPVRSSGLSLASGRGELCMPRYPDPPCCSLPMSGLTRRDTAKTQKG